MVHEGDACLCGGAACGNAGIAASDLDRWSIDREAACPPGQELCSAAPCPQLAPACVASSCTVRTPINIDASQWDASCTSDDDCFIVHEGDPCSNCICGGTAVNVSARDEYDALRDSQMCTPGPSDCDCAVATDAWCDAGTCSPGTNPLCTNLSSEGFFDDCSACGDGDCETITTPSGTSQACGCSGGCPCGLRCGSYEIAPGVTVSNICVR